MPITETTRNARFHLTCLTALALIGLFGYSNTFDASFHLDDGRAIVENASIRTLTDFGTIWKSNPTRFLGNLSFAFNFHIGNLNVFGYHVINLMIHIVGSFAVYWLAFLLLALAKNPSDTQRKWLPALTAGLFVSHPIQTQAVTYIIQRYASMATLFYLLALCLYLTAWKERFFRKHKQGKSFYFWIALAYACTFAAMFTKETAVTLPLVIVLIDHLFVKPNAKEDSKPILRYSPFLFLLLTIPLTLWLTGYLAASPHKQGFTLPHPGANWPYGRTDYLFTQFNVTRTYLRLMFLPFSQNIMHDYPIVHSLWNLTTLFSAALIAGLLYLAVRTAPRVPIVSFGIAFFFLSLAPESSIIPIEDVIFEHRLYLPSIGFFLAVGSAVLGYRADSLKPEKRAILHAVLAIWIAGLSLLTFSRNSAWQNEITLWQDAISKAPNKAMSHNNLGSGYANNGELEKAKKEFLIAIRLDPQFAPALSNLGAYYHKKRDLQAAIDCYLRAVKANPRYAKARLNLGRAYAESGEAQKALECFRRIIQNTPNSSEAYTELGNLFLVSNALDSAISTFQLALQLDPKSVLAIHNLGAAYQKRGMVKKAIRQFEKALILDPSRANSRMMIGHCYKIMGSDNLALAEYRKAIELRPNLPAAHNNMGVIYEARGEARMAISAYQKALQMDPDMTMAKRNLGRVLQLIGQ